VGAAARHAGLTIVATYGQRPGAVLQDGPDEQACTKTVFILRHATGGAS
jgi:hypothetical protein